MNVLKKIGLIFVLLVVGMSNIFVYLNSHLYYKSQGQEDAKKIEFLERSNKYCPLNDAVFYELGKSYLDMGLKRLDNAAAAESYFQKSVSNLKKSIMINPASLYSHFYLGQALLQLDLFSPEKGRGFQEEFRKAALLAGEESRIFNEVGRLFLSRWPELSTEDRDFTLAVLRKIIERRDPEIITALLNIWELNAKDYDIIDKVLPSDPQVYRQFARYLGEKSLSLEQRQKYLAQAELLEFSRARREFEEGEAGLVRFQTREAFGHLKNALELLKGIRFYQTLTAENIIRSGDYIDFLKSTLLSLAKCQIEERAGFSEVEDYLRQYLSLEDRTSRIGELETYLRDRGVLPAKFEKSAEDLRRLAFELLLLFKQTKYREIITFGRELEQSFIVVPEAKRPDYVRILQLIGDSLTKIDYLYDAGDIYLKAQATGPADLETLLRIRQNYERLNDERKKKEITIEIEKIMTPSEVNFRNLRLNKGVGSSQNLIFDGQKIILDLYFEEVEESAAPLISVFFNDRVVWEGQTQQGMISLNLETKVGANRLQIVPVNRPASLAKLAYRFSDGNNNPQVLRRPN